MGMVHNTVSMVTCRSADSTCLCLCCPVQAPGAESVWRQLLRHFLSHRDPGLAYQAAEATIMWFGRNQIRR